jgi:hypothetical protein
MKLVSSVSCVSLEKCVVIRLSHMLCILFLLCSFESFRLIIAGARFSNDEYP